jgi:hypothetical protein
MCIEATSLLRDSYHHSSKLFSVLQFYSFNLFYLFNRSYCSLDIFCCSCISVLLYSIYYSFHSTHKSRSVVSKKSALHLFFFVHVPDKIWVQEVGTRTNRSFARSIASEPEQNSWGMRRKMMEQEILLKCFSRNPLCDKGMK